MGNINQFKKNVNQLIAQNRIKEAIKKMREFMDSDDLILQSARFHYVKNAIHKDIISDEEAQLTKSKINAALLAKLEELEEEQETIEIVDNKRKMESLLTDAVEIATKVYNINNNQTQTADKIYNINKIDNANFS